jgi:hypothetical protein
MNSLFPPEASDFFWKKKDEGENHRPPQHDENK